MTQIAQTQGAGEGAEPVVALSQDAFEETLEGALVEPSVVIGGLEPRSQRMKA
jgi:hypothetical protein